MADIPSMDEILKEGRKQDRRKEIVLGSILLVGGLAFTLGMRELTGGAAHYTSFGAIGLGVALIAHGLFRTT
jgi:hypothetical protein